MAFLTRRSGTGHQGLICRECGAEAGLADLRSTTAGDGLVCPACASEAFGI